MCASITFLCDQCFSNQYLAFSIWQGTVGIIQDFFHIYCFDGLHRNIHRRRNHIPHSRCSVKALLINQSISITPISHRITRISGMTAHSVFNRNQWISFITWWDHWASWCVCEGKAKFETCVLRHFLKVTIEVAEQTDSGDVSKERGTRTKYSCACVRHDPKNQLSDSFV